MNKAMIDIETLSTSSDNALVISIGAVRFALENDSSPTIGGTFYRVLNLAEQHFMGREVSGDTVKFWGEQEIDSRVWLYEAQSPCYSSLIDLASFLSGIETIWANGVVFDIGNLLTLYADFKVAVPWKYNAVRDSRTICRDFPAYREAKPIEGLTAHHPVSDCIYQIHRLWERWPIMPPAVGGPGH